MPKVRDVIEALGEYNPDADVSVIVHNHCEAFSISFGSSEGCTMQNCDSVAFYVDELNVNEAQHKEPDRGVG